VITWTYPKTPKFASSLEPYAPKPKTQNPRPNPKPRFPVSLDPWTPGARYPWAPKTIFPKPGERRGQAKAAAAQL